MMEKCRYLVLIFISNRTVLLKLQHNFNSDLGLESQRHGCDFVLARLPGQRPPGSNVSHQTVGRHGPGTS